MSSWKQTSSLRSLPNDSFFCKIGKSGYGSNFFNFYMCYLFAQYKGKKLYINDTANNLSKEYHFIFDTLKPLPGIEYTTQKGITIQQAHTKDLNTFIDTVSKEFLIREANRIFQLNSTTQSKVDIYKQGLPSFDCGVHVRTGDKITTGEMKKISFERYLDSIRAYQHSTGKNTSFHIYLMTDSQAVIEYFQKMKDTSWIVSSIPSPNRFTNGHDQEAYNSQSQELRFQCFYHFLAELQILQECPHSLCTFSSNIGRLLDLTKKGTIESLD